MTMINSLRWQFKDADHRKFVAQRLTALKQALRTEIHQGTSERSLRLATWNLMHFGDGGGYDRTPESMLYIAEIIDHFDLVAVQEVNRDLTKLEELIDKHLGSAWDYIVTDTTGGSASDRDAGNNERLAFLYRKAKVQFCKEAGEIVLPSGQEIVSPDAKPGEETRLQFARTPFSVAFRSAWLKFKLCTVHIYYGTGKPGLEHRKAEIHKIAGFLAQRQVDECKAMVTRAKERGWTRPEDAGWDANYILLGDFNIISPEHGTMKALTEAGFTVPDKMKALDLGRDHHYDQIVTKAAHPGFTVLNSGVFDMLAHVYREEDAAHYAALLPKGTLGKSDDPAAQAEHFARYYRVHQMSDHKLLWCEIGVDYSDRYLADIIAAS
jgi:hypothetical protein